MASCANSHHFSLLQHSFPFWFVQICEFANASPGPPTKVAYLKTKNLIFVILERRSSGEFLAELYRKMFLRQTPDFVNFVLAAAGDVQMFAIPLETGNEENIKKISGVCNSWAH